MRFSNTRLFFTLLASSLVACSGGDDGDDVNIPPTGNITIAFSASAASVAPGGKVTLTWAVTGVDSATVDITAAPGGAVVSGSTMLSGTAESGAITEATTFTLVAKSGSASKMATAAVTVDSAAITINSFTATPNPAARGGTVLLSWDVAGATQIRVIEVGGAELFNSSTMVTTGAIEAMVDQATHTYRLEAQNDSSTSQQMVTVTTEAPPAIDFFRIRPPTFTGAMADVSITWNAAGSTIALTANGTAVDSFPGTETGTISVTVTETTVFELSASGAGTTVSQRRVVARAQGEVEPNDTSATATPLTEAAVSGEIDPETDVDFYSVSIPDNGNIALQIVDADGQCSNDFEITLIDTDGMTELGVTASSGGCFLIDPTRQAFAANLPAGTYFIRIDPFVGTGTYTLIALVGTAACGNEILEPATGEQCDDGNTADGDSCSSTCQISARGTVTGIGQDMTFTGAIDPATTQDYYRIELSGPANIFAETGVPTIGICEGSGMNDTNLVLLDGTFATLGNNDDDGPGLCSFIDPNFDEFAQVAAGTYYVRVESFSGGQRIPTYQVRIRTTAPTGCGNGIIEDGTEMCDDFNTTDGDGCSSTCQIEIAGTLSASGSVPVTLGPADGFPRFVEVVLAQAGSTITATTSDGSGSCPSPTDMALLSGDFSMQFGGVTGNGGCAGFGPPAQTFSTDLPAGTYVIGVAATSGAGGPISVDVTITAPGCGNGILEASTGETCDDGNTMGGDGCSATCQYDGNSETEPNDTIGQANASNAMRGGPAVTFSGAITPGDVDLYSFSVPAGQTATLEAVTYGALGDQSVCAFDSVLTLFDAQGTELTTDDDGGSGLCSSIDGTLPGAANLAAGTYYVEVRGYDEFEEFANYFVDIRLVP